MKIFNSLILLPFIAKVAFSFKCSEVFLDTKETLDKVLNGVKEVETKTRLSNSEEIITWYINPCDSIENKPEGDIKCPKDSRVCYVKSTIFDNDSSKKRYISDIKGYAIDGPNSEPITNSGDFIMKFQGEKNTNFNTEIKFTCAGNSGTDPIVELEKDTVNIVFKGICVSNSKESPVEDNDGKKDERKRGGGHAIVKFIVLLIVCYFVVGIAYNFFALQKRGIEVIPNIDLWLAIYDGISEKISVLFGRRQYSQLLQ